jgi:excisionase family DNA binding protein
MSDVKTRVCIRVSEFAQMFDIGRTKAYAMVRAGEIPSVRIGTALRIPVEGLQAYIGSLAAESKQGLNGEQADARRSA